MTSIDVILFIYYSRNKARETIINFQTDTAWPKKFNMTFLDNNVSAQLIYPEMLWPMRKFLYSAKIRKFLIFDKQNINDF